MSSYIDHACIVHESVLQSISIIRLITVPTSSSSSERGFVKSFTMSDVLNKKKVEKWVEKKEQKEMEQETEKKR